MGARASWFRGLLGCALIVAALATPWLGSGSLTGATGEFVLWQLRVPRVLVGLLVGGTLGVVGAVYQALFRNPLATPSTVGTLAGATLGALAAFVLGFSSSLGMPAVVVASFVGAALASALVAATALSGRARTSDVLLAGIAVTLAAGAISSAIQSMADSRALFAAARWSLGQLAQVGYDGVWLLLPFCGVSVVVLLALGRPLAVMSLGEELARTRGVPVTLVRGLALAAGAIGVSACVAWCGPIAFVGLIVPHLARLIVGPRLAWIAPASLVFGGCFLVACDTAARVLLARGELPVGVMTAGLGAPALVLLLVRARRS